MTIFKTESRNFKNGIVKKNSKSTLQDAAYQLENVEVLNDGSIVRRKGIKIADITDPRFRQDPNKFTEELVLLPTNDKEDDTTIFAIAIDFATVYKFAYLHKYKSIGSITSFSLKSIVTTDTTNTRYFNVTGNGIMLAFAEHTHPYYISTKSDSEVYTNRLPFTTNLTVNFAPTTSIDFANNIRVEVIENASSGADKQYVKIYDIRHLVNEKDIDSTITLNNYTYFCKILDLREDSIICEVVSTRRITAASHRYEINQASLPTFGSYFGFPTTTANFDSRAFYAGAKKLPTTIWISKVNEKYSLALEDADKITTIGRPVVVNNSFEDAKTISIDGTDQDEIILHLVAGKVLYIFTNKNIYTLEPDSNSLIGYKIVKILSVTCSKEIMPIVSLNNIFFVTSDHLKLYKLIYNSQIENYQLIELNDEVKDSMKEIKSFTINSNNELISVITKKNECYKLRISEPNNVFAWYKTSFSESKIFAHCNFLDTNLYLMSFDKTPKENNNPVIHIAYDDKRYFLDFQFDHYFHARANPDDPIQIVLNNHIPYDTLDLIHPANFVENVKISESRRRIDYTVRQLPEGTRTLQIGKAIDVKVYPKLDQVIAAKNRSIDGFVKVRKINLDFETSFKTEFIISGKKFQFKSGKLVNGYYRSFKGKKSFIVLANYIRDLEDIFKIDTKLPYSFKINSYNLEINYN